MAVLCSEGIRRSQVRKLESECQCVLELELKEIMCLGLFSELYT